MCTAGKLVSAPAAALICSITAPLTESNLTSLSTGISFLSTETENTTAVCVCCLDLLNRETPWT